MVKASALKVIQSFNPPPLQSLIVRLRNRGRIVVADLANDITVLGTGLRVDGFVGVALLTYGAGVQVSLLHQKDGVVVPDLDEAWVVSSTGEVVVAILQHVDLVGIAFHGCAHAVGDTVLRNDV